MRRITDWISSLLSKSSTDSASEPQSKAEQGDAEAQHKHGRANADSREPEGEGLCDLECAVDDAPVVVKLVNHILTEAIKRRASEIHIESNEDSFWISYRIDGILNKMMIPRKRLQVAVINRVKIMAKLEIWKKQLPYYGRIGVRVEGRAHDHRVSIVPASCGEKVLIWIPDSTNATIPKDGA